MLGAQLLRNDRIKDESPRQETVVLACLTSTKRASFGQLSVCKGSLDFNGASTRYVVMKNMLCHHTPAYGVEKRLPLPTVGCSTEGIGVRRRYDPRSLVLVQPSGVCSDGSLVSPSSTSSLFGSTFEARRDGHDFLTS